MKVIIKIIIITLISLSFSCDEKSKTATNKPTIKLIIFADKTGSIVNNSIPQLTKEHLKKLLEYIDKNGGEIALSNITDISKENLSIIRNLPKPIIKQGETAEEFNLRIKNWKEQSETFQPSDFLTKPKVKEILNYAKLYKSTNIADAVDLANIYLNSNDYFDSDCRRIALFITDGEDNVGKNLPDKFKYEIFMVTRSSNTGSLSKYNPILHPTIESAINDILKQ